MKSIIKIILIGLLTLTSCDDPNTTLRNLDAQQDAHARKFLEENGYLSGEEYAKVMQARRKAAQARKEASYE